MLVLSKMIVDRPVLSLRTGHGVATAHAPIINPHNLKIEGFYCTDSVDRKKQLILTEQDIRDVLPAGIVIDDHEVLSEPEDLVRLSKIMDIQFELVGKKIVTESKRRVGKVNDYALDPDSMMISKLYATQGLVKSITGASLSIDRSYIVEVTNDEIIIRDTYLRDKIGAPALATT